MYRRFSSIRYRIIAIIVLSAFNTASASAIFVRAWTRSTERDNLIRSTEFNLNLVSGLVKQRLDSLEMFLSWCCVNSDIASYLSSANQNQVLGSHIADAMSERLQIYYQLIRIIIVNDDANRILQNGFGTAEGIPITPFTIDRLENIDWGEDLGVWHGIDRDPFSPSSSHNAIYIRQAVRGLGSFRKPVGVAYMLVNASIITDSLKDYDLPEGCSLYLSIGGKTFAYNSSFHPVDVDFTLKEDNTVRTLNPATVVTRLRDENGASFVAVNAPIGDTGIWLTQSISEDTINKNYRAFFGPQLLMIVLIVLIQSLILHRMMHVIFSRPIEKLQSRMHMIAGGDFTADETIEWPNELGDIGRGINELSRDIHALMDHKLADEKAKQSLEYQMLQHQVNPHFLYNSLNSIKWMATIQNATGIAEMTSSLARLLKSVSKGQHAMITLAEEISLLDDYYIIQKYRYGGALTFRKQIEEGTESAYLPRFALQPLMENAIFHGIEPKGSGTITVRSRREMDTLILEVEDDGVGMDADRPILEDSDEAFQKVGLANTQQRIRYAFGEEYGLTIQSRLGEFTRITIRIPMLTQLPEEL